MKTYPRAKNVDEALERASKLVMKAGRRYNRIGRAKERFGSDAALMLLARARVGLETAERELNAAYLMRPGIAENVSYLLLINKVMRDWENIGSIVEQFFRN